jgi:hypothetical protein
VTYNVITRIKAVLINALIGLLVILICSPTMTISDSLQIHAYTSNCLQGQQGLESCKAAVIAMVRGFIARHSVTELTYEDQTAQVWDQYQKGVLTEYAPAILRTVSMSKTMF